MKGIGGGLNKPIKCCQTITNYVQELPIYTLQKQEHIVSTGPMVYSTVVPPHPPPSPTVCKGNLCTNKFRGVEEEGEEEEEEEKDKKTI